jgi:hypothetical protein
VTTPCVGRRSRLPMPQHRSKRRGGADGQPACPAFDQPRYLLWRCCHAGPIPTWADSAPVRADASVTQLWWTDASDRTRQSGCVAPLERAKTACWSGRTRADAMRWPAEDALSLNSSNLHGSNLLTI